jgi:diguanylate cyclase (GGDEF)-like protein
VNPSRPGFAHRSKLLQAPLLAAALCLFAGSAHAAAAAHPAAALVQQAIKAGRANPDVARRLADEALGQLESRPDPDLQVRAQLVLCDYYLERDLARVRELLTQAGAQLQLARRAGLRSGVFACEGDLYEAEGDNARAMSAYERAVSAAEVAADDEFLANALYLRGWLRGVQGEYALGLADMRRSVALFERGNFPEHSRTAVNGIATLYNRMGDYVQAQQYFDQAARAQLAAGLEREAAISFYNLGRTRENLGQWDEAQRAYLQVQEISRRISYPRGEAYAERGLAAVHIARKEWQRGLDRVAAAQALGRSLPDARLDAHLALLRGIALRGLQRPAQSLESLNRALEVFTKAEAAADVAATHRALAATYVDLGDWRAAFEQQRLLQEAGARLHERQLDQRVLTLKVEFDTAARDKENALLQREKAATEAALAQAQRAGRLQAAVIVLAAALALLLGVLAWRQRQTSARMRALAMTDELTGLPNRRAVLARLADQLDAGRACAVLIVDIDHFKRINDRHGHPVGDEVLRAVAAALAADLVSPQCAGRLGGEEFMLLLPQATPQEAMQAAERLRAAVARLDTARWLGGQPLSVSVGVAQALPGPGAVSDVLRRADEALYAAKDAGRDRVHASEAVLAS